MAEKITEKIAALPEDTNFFSLEFFPPKTDIGFSNLHARLLRMASALRPLYVTVTWGAGGSTHRGSLELAELCQRQLGLTTCLHLTCTNMHKHIVDEVLKEAKEIGIRNILALRGDPPRGHEYTEDGKGFEGQDELVWAADLVRYIRRHYGDYFCIAVAGYPEGHSDESNPDPATQSPLHDLPYLVEKVKAGGDFIMTQLFYDEKAFIAYEKLVRGWDGGVLKDIPIIPGLMPIQSFQVLKRVAKLSHASLPRAIFERLEPLRNDDDAVKREGIDILSTIINDIKASPSPQRRGFHFYTLNLEKSVSYILEKTELIPPITPGELDPIHSSDSSAVIVDTPASGSPPLSHLLPNGAHNPLHAHPHTHPRRRPSSPHNHITSDSPFSSRSGSLAAPGLPRGVAAPPDRAVDLAIAHGVGAVGREATWDDYPNGRFGDARSPAFGEIDGYGGPTLRVSARTARDLWGVPAARADVDRLFQQYLKGKLQHLPWSEGALSAETRVVEPWLLRMAARGWWSVASQPACDGARSGDRVFGWGPPGGFVFQKPFVEFWAPVSDWRERLRPRLAREAEEGRVSWFATRNPLPPAVQSPDAAETDPAAAPDEGDGKGEGDADADCFDASEPDAVHSVTWGSFPGKEIVSPTIIEAVSFRSWAEEAFGLWREWERCYPAASASRRLLRACARDCCLVNVVGHVYQEPNMLWELLLSI